MVAIELVLATPVCEFDWELPGGAENEGLDMTENTGITIHKKHPLIAIANPYSYRQKNKVLYNIICLL